MLRPSDQEIIVEVVSMWNRLSDEERQESGFLQSSKEDLIQFHHTFGARIRNEWRLWSYHWTPELVDGIDMSSEHPDAISMRVLEAVWEIAKEIEDAWNA